MAGTVLTNKRLMSDYYDSIQQRDRVGEEAEATFEELLGRMRLDLLRFERLVITDAQLLDGAAFLAVGPANLLESIERTDFRDPSRPSLEVRARGDNLSDALVGLVNRGGDALTGFTFSSIQDEAVRDHVHQELSKVPAARVTEWRQLPQVLQEVGLPGEDADRLRDRWGEWIEAQRVGALKVVRWALPAEWPTFDAMRSEAFHREEPDTYLRARLDDGPRDALDHVLSIQTLRNDVDVYLRGQITAAGPRDAAELQTIASWFNRAYNRAIAIQHGCAFDSTYSDGLRPANPAQGLADDMADASWSPGETQVPVLDVPREFVSGLGSMVNADYRRAGTETATELRAWWTSGDLNALRNFADAFARRVPGNWSRRPSASDALVVVGTAALGAGLGGAAAAHPAGLPPGAPQALGAGLGAVVGAGLRYVLRGPLSPARSVAKRIVEYESQRWKSE